MAQAQHSDFDESMRWGLDLFTHGYYWEAHEAWEEVWTTVERGSARWALSKGLILLAASGVKLRTGGATAAVRHAKRAAFLLRMVAGEAAERFASLSGWSPSEIAELADRVALAPEVRTAALGAPPEVVPNFAPLSVPPAEARAGRDG